MSPIKPLIGIAVSRSSAQTPPHLPLFALHPLYSEGVMAGGGAPLQIPLGLDQDALRTIFDRVDGLLFAGGGDVAPAYYGEQASDRVYGVDRERDELEMALVRWAVETGKPFFAICRGMQMMNVALGGSLYQDILSEMLGAIRHNYFEELGFNRNDLAHDVRLTPNSRLAKLLGGVFFSVNSLHHQGIKALAVDLTAVAHAPDGLIEAVEIAGHPFAIGVQWHPEALAPSDPVMRRMFEELIAAARR